MEAVLSVRDVAFQYGAEPVLKGASLDVMPGSFVGLVGPNGSGKTTLLRIAAGLLKPSWGSVTVCGRPAAGMRRSELARQLALLPQNPSLPLTFKARDLAMMGRTPFLGLLGRESREDLEAVDRAMEMAHCEEMAERRLEELSGGERQRVLLARALAQQPRVLLMDEPTAHMDMRHQIGVADLVVELVRGGLAAVGVFHDLNLAACYCDRIAVLHEGTIVVEGPPVDVMREGLLSQVFGVDLCLTDHPRVPVPAVLPPGNRNHQDTKDTKIHEEGVGNGRARLLPSHPEPSDHEGTKTRNSLKESGVRHVSAASDGGAHAPHSTERVYEKRGRGDGTGG